MSSKDTTIANVRLSPESRRVLEASISAGTSGSGLWLLVAVLTAITALALATALAIVATSAAAGLAGDVGQLQKAAFALVFALPFAIALAFQIRFLRRLRAG